MRLYIKRITMFIIFISLFIVSFKVYGESNKTVIIDNDGVTVKTRTTNEPVYRLTNFNYPLQQLRGVFVSIFTGSIPSYEYESKWKKDIDDMLDTVSYYGLNTIIFHVWTHNNALYNSKLNPKAIYFKDVNFEEFDPLAYVIEETHDRGMEFHAWMTPFLVDDSYNAEEYPSNNPALDPTNINSGMLNPGIPQVREFLVDSCIEFLNNYDVDAIHLDDNFYTDGFDDEDARNLYNTSNLTTQDFRRESLTQFIHLLHDEITLFNSSNNRYVQLGVSPSGIYQNDTYTQEFKYNSNGELIEPSGSNTNGNAHFEGPAYADSLKWINCEYIDYIMPRCFWSLEHSAFQFSSLTS